MTIGVGDVVRINESGREAVVRDVVGEYWVHVMYLDNHESHPRYLDIVEEVELVEAAQPQPAPHVAPAQPERKEMSWADKAKYAAAIHPRRVRRAL